MPLRSKRRDILIRRARHMRKNPTPGENCLWQRLRGRQLADLKFRRQHVMAPYIVDFYCAEAGLVVELDGDVHAEDEQGGVDRTRTEKLREEYDVEVLRFSESLVVRETEAVLRTIWRRCTEKVEG